MQAASGRRRLSAHTGCTESAGRRWFQFPSSHPQCVLARAAKEALGSQPKASTMRTEDRERQILEQPARAQRLTARSADSTECLRAVSGMALRERSRLTLRFCESALSKVVKSYRFPESKITRREAFETAGRSQVSRRSFSVSLRSRRLQVPPEE
eukprot:5612003-Prymnesium_polylepis.2